jgi:2'-hydroxyisoflavone reductase
MKLLILGGTRFVGRHLVEAALARGHQLSLFNRGLSGAALFPGLDIRHGDRRADLSALAEGEWDAVIDTCGYIPRELQASAGLLAGRVGRYLFISSISAYAGFAAPNDEDAPLGVLADPATEQVDGASYGPLKAACEAALREGLGDAATLILRPGLIVGPHDPTQRFSYWPARLARARDGEAVLAPGAPGDGLQFIDARDLAAFALELLERGASGCYNAVAAPDQWTRGELLQACAAAAGVRPRWVWAADARLQALGVQPWSELPLWLPGGGAGGADGDFAAFMATPNQRALAAGLRIRPLAQTVADTLAWWRGLPVEAQAFDKAGLSATRERELLAALQA